MQYRGAQQYGQGRLGCAPVPVLNFIGGATKCHHIAGIMYIGDSVPDGTNLVYDSFGHFLYATSPLMVLASTGTSPLMVLASTGRPQGLTHNYATSETLPCAVGGRSCSAASCTREGKEGSALRHRYAPLHETLREANIRP